MEHEQSGSNDVLDQGMEYHRCFMTPLGAYRSILGGNVLSWMNLSYPQLMGTVILLRRDELPDDHTLRIG